jgi:hypothetical protein
MIVKLEPMNLHAPIATFKYQFQKYQLELIPAILY